MQPGTGSGGLRLGPCGEADSTSERILFLTSGLPLFQLLNKILPPLRCYFCCPLCPACGSDRAVVKLTKLAFSMHAICRWGFLQNEGHLASSSFWSPSLFLYVLLCSRGQAPQTHSLYEECRGFGNRCPAGWGLPPRAQLALSREMLLVLQFPLWINRLLPPQTCLSESGKECKKEEKQFKGVSSFLSAFMSQGQICIKIKSFLLFLRFIRPHSMETFNHAFIIYFCFLPKTQRVIEEQLDKFEKYMVNYKWFLKVNIISKQTVILIIILWN